MAVESIAENVQSTADSIGVAGARQRLLANIISNVAYTGLTIVANFLLTPFLIGRLGIAAYGMIPLVNTITAYMAVITTALDTSVSRFLTIDLEQHDARLANRTFNAALFGILGIVTFLGFIAVGLALLFPVLFKIPAGTEADVSWLFLTVSVGFFISVVGGVFAVAPFVHSQFLWMNSANIVALLSRVLLTVGLFLILPPRLWYSGGGALVGSALSTLIFIYLWRKLTPQLHISFRDFDRSRLFMLLSMGGWVMVNTAGAMLLSRVDLIVVNSYFGAAMTGAYGSVAQLSTLMDSLVTAISSVLRPVMLIKFSQNDIEGLKRVSIVSVKILGFALALPAGLLCGFSSPVLKMWLGPSYQYLSLLVVVLVSHFSINYSVRPLLYVQNAYNKVRWPGIATLAAGLLDMVLAVLVARYTNWGYIGVALVGVLVWTLKNSVYMPIYTARIMRFHWWTFYPGMATGLVATILVGFASYGLTLVRMPQNILSLLVYFIVVSVVYVVVVWLVGFTNEDRRMLLDLPPLKYLNLSFLNIKRA